MIAVHFEESNAIYGKPKGMTDEQCYSVSALETKDENGNIIKISTVWLPNKEDIEAIKAGRPIVLTVFGSGLPPVSLFTLDENGNSNG